MKYLLTENFLADSLKVMLLCGSDLLESFSTPGVWILDQVRISKLWCQHANFHLNSLVDELTRMMPTSVSRSEPYARTLVLFVYAEKEKMSEN
jgi:hypothetical protein